MRFLAVQAVCGVIAGWLVALVMMAIAVPNFSNIMMPVGMAASYAKLEGLGVLFIKYKTLWTFCALAFPVVSWYFTARMINPGFPGLPFRDAPKPRMAWTIFVCAGVLFFAGLGLIFGHVGPSEPNSPGLTIFGEGEAFLGVLGVLLCGLGWFVVSADGMAGDLSSWKALSRDKLGRHVSALMSGLLFGVAAGAAAVFVKCASWFAFALNVEVWAYCAETCHEGAVGIIWVFCAVCGAGSLLAFSAIPALASDDRSGGALLRKAAPFLALTAIFIITVAGIRSHAVANYDWDAGGLAKAAGLDEKVPPEMSLVFLDPEGKGAVELDSWPVEAKYSSLIQLGSVPATPGNAELLKKYLSERYRSSRYRQAVVSAYPSIHTALWDIDGAVAAKEWVDSLMGPEYGMSIYGVMMKLVWLSRAAPVTEANIKRLEALGDADHYQIPARAALHLSRGWHRMGDAGKAERWLKLAREKGAEERDIKEVLGDRSKGGGMGGGSVRGRIRIGNEPAPGVKVGLFVALDGKAWRPSPQDFLARLAVSAVTGKDGSFGLSDLSGGEYYLCLLAPSALISPKAEDVSVSNHPGMIKLHPGRRTADLGTIALKVGGLKPGK
ncbi:hypothetical protein ACFL2T_00955 [Elusimicrobiota bacterium]